MSTKRSGKTTPQSDAPGEGSSDEAAPPYAVGYGKPPAHSRFKPGHSGNPRGKPKGRKSYKAIVAAALNEKIAVQTPHGRKRMIKLEALIQTNINNALKGDAKATDQILKIAREYGHADEIAEALDAAAMVALREEDQTILARHLGKGEPDPAE